MGIVFVTLCGDSSRIWIMKRQKREGSLSWSRNTLDGLNSFCGPHGSIGHDMEICGDAPCMPIAVVWGVNVGINIYIYINMYIPYMECLGIMIQLRIGLGIGVIGFGSSQSVSSTSKPNRRVSKRLKIDGRNRAFSCFFHVEGSVVEKASGTTLCFSLPYGSCHISSEGG